MLLLEDAITNINLELSWFKSIKTSLDDSLMIQNVIPESRLK